MSAIKGQKRSCYARKGNQQLPAETIISCIKRFKNGEQVRSLAKEFLIPASTMFRMLKSGPIHPERKINFLRQEAKSKGIKFFSIMNRAQILEVLQANDFRIKEIQDESFNRWKSGWRQSTKEISKRKLDWAKRTEQSKKLKEKRHLLGISINYIKRPNSVLTEEEKIKRIERKRYGRKKYKALKRMGGDLSIKTIQLVYEDNIKLHGTLTCYLCLVPIEFKKDHLEHKIPLSRGGTNIYENLAVACQKCNCMKHNKTEDEFKRGVKTKHGRLLHAWN